MSAPHFKLIRTLGCSGKALSIAVVRDEGRGRVSLLISNNGQRSCVSLSPSSTEVLIEALEVAIDEIEAGDAIDEAG